MEKMIRFFKDEEGATAVEYGLLVALIAAVIVCRGDAWHEDQGGVSDDRRLRFSKDDDREPAAGSILTDRARTDDPPPENRAEAKGADDEITDRESDGDGEGLSPAAACVETGALRASSMPFWVR